MEGRTREAGKGFGLAVAAPESASTYERLIAFVGRDASEW
jgi:hypothetical protein